MTHRQLTNTSADKTQPSASKSSANKTQQSATERRRRRRRSRRTDRTESAAGRAGKRRESKGDSSLQQLGQAFTYSRQHRVNLISGSPVLQHSISASALVSPWTLALAVFRLCSTFFSSSGDSERTGYIRRARVRSAAVSTAVAHIIMPVWR